MFNFCKHPSFLPNASTYIYLYYKHHQQAIRTWTARRRRLSSIHKYLQFWREGGGVRDFRELREAKGMPQDNTNDDIAACDNTNAETNVDSGDG